MSLNVNTAVFEKLAEMKAYGPLVTALEGKVERVILVQPLDAAKRRTFTAPNDFPAVIVASDGNAVLPSPTTPMTFGMQRLPREEMDWGVPGTLRFAIVTIYRNTTDHLRGPVEAAIDKFLMERYPKLELSWVTRFNFSDRVSDEKSEMTGNVLRTVRRRMLMVDVRPKMSALTQ